MHLKSARIYGLTSDLVYRDRKGNGVSSVMDIQQLDRHLATDRPARRACLVAGCPCKDARMVSHRRAAFFASWAASRGETADRVVAPDPTWRIDPDSGPLS